MSEYTAVVSWKRTDEVFTDNGYSRAHSWRFDGGLNVAASASPQHVRVPLSNPAAVDPEEAYVAALSSCHMLFFLHLAAGHGFVVDHYHDEAVGIMEQDEHKRLAITRVRLRPRVTFAPASTPTPPEIDHLHHEAHERCYLANSVRTHIVIEALLPE